uniref:UDP-N-acetylmuramate--L-alanine ligase n=1 Tax=Candidatus Kentrum sp. FM TaxID=2126340 RepID=A0A450SDI5_9GAMM|nr:MAG: UDP-N-acetylmuramate--alanine ligase [Candidatus Kentron sp. FM]VFJ54618.1 MAG: UDP-N-acetylmuramate--alanine ligase [Candidatus Kentron sp. FM]VFK10547.1 MAG: UDP-N-acetylmuramate--alanine ligase [Candidatus Kentron sp. FM]
MANSEWMGRVRHIHFVGIGGAGMGGIAEVLHGLGYRISGSDKTAGKMVQRLRKLGVPIGIGHASSHVDGADVVVVSSAVGSENVEVVNARRQHIPVIPRAEMLAELMRFRYGIAVAGTHGKTTVTSLIASLLTEAGLDPTFVIGGRLNRANTHAHLGLGHYLVAEADESDKSFLYLNPIMAVVTNIDADHMGTYGGDFDCLKETFLTFLRRLPFYGLAVLCVDDPVVKDLMGKVSRPVMAFGFGADANFRADKVRQDGVFTTFEVLRPAGKPPLTISLNLPGRHNVSNALAAIAIADELGVPDDAIQRALSGFQGIARRFQVFGEVSFGEALSGGRRVLLIDDYGHHPREIAATLDTIRASWPTRRLVVAFQPHRYTRTRDLFDDFVRVLSKPDVLLLLDIYAASEAPLPGVTGKALYQAICNYGDYGGSMPLFVENVSDLADALSNVVKDGDVVLTLGAGDIDSIVPKLIS